MPSLSPWYANLQRLHSKEGRAVSEQTGKGTGNVGEREEHVFAFGYWLLENRTFRFTMDLLCETQSVWVFGLGLCCWSQSEEAEICQTKNLKVIF